MYLSAFIILCKTHQCFCDLTPNNFKFHNGLNSNKTARARHNIEKRSFEKRELILMNLI